MYNYSQNYDQTVADYETGKITQNEAGDRIMEIEQIAYEMIPNAEPDGDITYGAALALEKVGLA